MVVVIVIESWPVLKKCKNNNKFWILGTIKFSLMVKKNLVHASRNFCLPPHFENESFYANLEQFQKIFGCLFKWRLKRIHY